MKYVLLSFGFFLVQNVSSFSRVARYTPSLSCILTSKIRSKSNKANLYNQPRTNETNQSTNTLYT